MTKYMRFRCPTCDKVLKAPPAAAGRRCRCPRCSQRMFIPGRALPTARALTPPRCMPPAVPQSQPASVPVSLSIPKLGAVSAQVSQGTANSMAKTVTGGLLVAVGVFLAAWFGVGVGGRRTA